MKCCCVQQKPTAVRRKHNSSEMKKMEKIVSFALCCLAVRSNVLICIPRPVRHLPFLRGTIVIPSGRLSSDLVRPEGSSWEGCRDAVRRTCLSVHYEHPPHQSCSRCSVQGPGSIHHHSTLASGFRWCPSLPLVCTSMSTSCWNVKDMHSRSSVNLFWSQRAPAALIMKRSSSLSTSAQWLSPVWYVTCPDTYARYLTGLGRRLHFPFL